MKPLLVSHEKIIPYLKRIDESRIYSNHGGLVEEYEQRLGERYGAHVCVTSSCTSAITACLMALELPRGSRCLVSSYTFVATVAAVEAAGLEPVFQDYGKQPYVYPDIKACVIAYPFGEAFDIVEWDAWSDFYGVPVVIDAAGGFDTVKHAGRTPICISTHATKVHSSGEGGFVISEGLMLIPKVRRICNFGFGYGRLVQHHGFNAKMSEYTAAVGLAELDYWPEKRVLWEDARTRYDERFGHTAMGYGTSLYTYIVSNAREAVEKLTSKGIGARRIWGDGCHSHTPYIHCGKFPMPETKRLCDTIITLPFYIGMTDDEMDVVAKAVKAL